MCVMWLVTHSCVWCVRDSLICGVTRSYSCSATINCSATITASLFITLPTQFVLSFARMTHERILHSHVRYVQFTCVIWLIHILNVTHSHMWYNSFIFWTWLIYMCDMTYSRVWCDPFTFLMIWLIQNFPHSIRIFFSFAPEPSEMYLLICVTWHAHVCDATHRFVSSIWMSHVTHMNESCYAWARCDWCIWVSHVARMNESCHT